MTPLIDQLNADLKTALRAGDEPRKNTLRQTLAGIQQARLEKRAAAAAAARKKLGRELTETEYTELEQTALDENEVLAVLQKQAKACREAIADALQANRADLIGANEAEIQIIEGYLPKAFTRAELVELAQAAIAEAGATELKQQGAVMKLLTPRTKGRADGKLVNEIVRELLNH